ncbi:amino acid/polyamine transporter I [Geranomyces variabilis]|nr:amino acid/polyamine transporter I [Geranomyces variabilis]KAJ3140497.1 hypothetical protein HDU90_007795 [Geranomyces variabilis]
MSTTDPSLPQYSSMSDDEIRLAKLGYKQGLKRQFSAFQNFGFVLTNASVLIGVVPLFGFGMAAGGPLALTWGWLIVSAFVLCIGLCMAEICSTYPTAGGLYYWTAKLGGPKYGPVFSWFEAWFNALGQIAGCSGSVLAAAQLLAEVIRVANGSVLSAYAVYGIFCAMVITGAAVSSAGGSALKVTSIASVWIHILGTVVIVITILATCPDKNSTSFVFSQFEDGLGATGEGFSPVLVFLIGLLPSQWSLLGYDSSAHMSEETEASYVNGPRGIVYTIIAAVLMGWALILGMTFSLGPYDDAIAVYNEAGSVASYVFTRSAGQAGGICLLMIVVAAGFACGVGTLTANSRMFYAFSRDGGLPASSFWIKLDQRSGMPVRLVWLSAVCVMILAIPSMFSVAALTAVSGISVIGFMVSYSIPVFLRITVGEKNGFVQSEFNLGKWSTLLGWIGCIWTLLATILFNFPQAYPVSAATLNYTPVAVGGMITFAGGWWLLGARKWFKGPVSDIAEPSSSTKTIADESPADTVNVKTI